MTLCVFNLRNRAGNSVMLLCIINDYVYDFMFMYERSYRDSVRVGDLRENVVSEAHLPHISLIYLVIRLAFCDQHTHTATTRLVA